MNFVNLCFKLPFQSQSTAPNFDANVDPKAKDKKPAKKDPNSQEQKTPFLLPKKQIKIKMDQTSELEIYAFFSKETEY